MLGSAHAFTHFAGQIAARVGADTFVADYRLAPEHPFPGFILVKAGDRVKRGQVIARIGDSGSSFEPHLHFEITTSNSSLRGEGLPYAFDGYTETTKGGAIQKRMRELPMDGTLVTFGN